MALLGMDFSGARTRMTGRSCLLVVLVVSSWASSQAYGGGLQVPPTHVGYSQFLLFPPKSAAMGVFLALSVPLDSVHHDVSMSYNFEANYELPTNATQLTELEAEYGFKRKRSLAAEAGPGAGPGAGQDQGGAGPAAGPLVRSLRDVERADVYAMLVGSIARAGLPGRQCLLRTICEASEWPMTNGLIGNLLTVLLTPSTSANEDLHPVFHEAERRGRRGADCALHYKKCPISLLSLLTEH